MRHFPSIPKHFIGGGNIQQKRSFSTLPILSDSHGSQRNKKNRYSETILEEDVLDDAIYDDLLPDLLHEADIPDVTGSELEAIRLAQLSDYADRRAAIENRFVAFCLSGGVGMMLAAGLLMLTGVEVSGGSFAAILAGAAAALALAALHRRARLDALDRQYREMGLDPDGFRVGRAPVRRER